MLFIFLFFGKIKTGFIEEEEKETRNSDDNDCQDHIFCMS